MAKPFHKDELIAHSCCCPPDPAPCPVEGPAPAEIVVNLDAKRPSKLPGVIQVQFDSVAVSRNAGALRVFAQKATTPSKPQTTPAGGMDEPELRRSST